MPTPSIALRPNRFSLEVLIALLLLPVSALNAETRAGNFSNIHSPGPPPCQHCRPDARGLYFTPPVKGVVLYSFSFFGGRTSFIIIDTQTKKICTYTLPSACIYSDLPEKQYKDTVNASNKLWNAQPGTMPDSESGTEGFQFLYIFDHDKIYKHYYTTYNLFSGNIGLDDRLFIAITEFDTSMIIKQHM